MHSGHFLYFDFGDASPIAHLETLGSGVFLSSPNVVSTYAEAIGSLRRAAMSERDSEQFIDTCLERAKETS